MTLLLHNLQCYGFGTAVVGNDFDLIAIKIVFARGWIFSLRICKAKGVCQGPQTIPELKDQVQHDIYELLQDLCLEVMENLNQRARPAMAVIY